MLLPCLSDMLCQVWNLDHFTCFKLSGNLWSYHKFLQVLIHTTKSDFTYGESYQDRSPFSAPFYILLRNTFHVLSREKNVLNLNENQLAWMSQLNIFVSHKDTSYSICSPISGLKNTLSIQATWQTS